MSSNSDSKVQRLGLDATKTANNVAAAKHSVAEAKTKTPAKSANKK